MALENQEILSEVVAECLEHAARMEDHLLALDRAGSEVEPEVVNSLFRSAHSIKGVVGFCGLSKIRDLAHAFENLLGAYRNGELIPDSEAVDVCLHTTDFLKTLLHDAAGSESADIDPYVEQLNRLLADGGQAPAPAVAALGDAGGRFSFTADARELRRLAARGYNFYVLSLDLVRDVWATGLSPQDFMDNLENLGTVLDSHFDPRYVLCNHEAERPESLPWGVLLASLLEPGVLSGSLGLPDRAWELLPGPEERRPATPGQPPAARAPAPPDPQAGVCPAAARDIAPENSLRIRLPLLDDLMSLAGELVLARNQLVRTVDALRLREVVAVSQRLDLITSELQDRVLQTRMQPLERLFAKFPRLVRDLTRRLGKQAELVMEGGEVELDKAILEELSDPLVHLLRNAVDHGLDTPAQRERAGKDPGGTLRLRAFNQGGQVNIELSDDGRGINPGRIKAAAVERGLITPIEAEDMPDSQALELIFHPGLSTADKVSDVSGRGVGMDVVRAGLERLGGTLELDSEVDVGTRVLIKLPLTMAIIPCLTVRVALERYAVPQVNLLELVRVRYNDTEQRLERVGGAEVLRLRGGLLPLVRLSQVLQVQGRYRDPDSGDLSPDRRVLLADRRSGLSHEQEQAFLDKRSGDDRRVSSQTLHVMVLAAGGLEYGLVVDELLETEEIVVKPLGRHLRDIPAFAGATIMGDGVLAPILDVAGLAQHAGLALKKEQAQKAEKGRRQRDAEPMDDRVGLLVFNYGRALFFALPLPLIARIERVQAGTVETSLGKHHMPYRGRSLRVIKLSDHLPLPEPGGTKDRFVLVFEYAGREMGLLATSLVDEYLVSFDLDAGTHRRPGVMGSLLIGGRTVLLLDLFELLDLALAGEEWPRPAAGSGGRVLVVEDSPFFRDKIGGYLREAGFTVFMAEDGAQGLSFLEENPVDAVLTDVQMPVMDGLAMVREIRRRPGLQGLKIAALTALSSEQDLARGLEAGVDRYLIKLDREALLEGLAELGCAGGAQ